MLGSGDSVLACYLPYRSTHGVYIPAQTSSPETAIARREAGGVASTYRGRDRKPVVAVATPTAHAQTLVRSETKSKVRPKN